MYMYMYVASLIAEMWQKSKFLASTRIDYSGASVASLKLMVHHLAEIRQNLRFLANTRIYAYLYVASLKHIWPFLQYSVYLDL